MIRAFGLALGDLLEPRVRGVVALVAAISGLVYVVIGGLLWWAWTGIDVGSWMGADFGLGWLGAPA